MKSQRLLLLVPFLLLTGCDTQKKIDSVRAKEIITQIQNKRTGLGSFLFTLSNKGVIGKDDDRKTVDLAYSLKYTSNAYYTSIKGNNGSIVYDSEMYGFYDIDYGEVKFIRYFNALTNEYVKEVATSTTSENFDVAFDNLGVYKPRTLFDYYANADFYIEPQDLDPGDSMKLLSSKDGQLIIEVTSGVAGEIPEEEVTIKGTSVYKYDNYRFMNVNVDTASNFGNKWLTKGKVEYSSKIEVKIPTDWKTYLKLEK